MVLPRCEFLDVIFFAYSAMQVVLWTVGGAFGRNAAATKTGVWASGGVPSLCPC